MHITVSWSVTRILFSKTINAWILWGNSSHEFKHYLGRIDSVQKEVGTKPFSLINVYFLFPDFVKTLNTVYKFILGQYLLWIVI